jgi:predicted lipoprotein with Yx(FWY)xxD motif
VGGQSEVPADSAAGPEVTTADSSLGEIVVDGQGLTAYMFTKDTQGSATSACTGECVGLWPAITSTAQTPIVDGVTGEIGTIPTANGQNQITVNGWPIYTYAGDQAPGDVTGQNVNGIWFVMSPDGKPIKDATDSAMSY